MKRVEIRSINELLKNELIEKLSGAELLYALFNNAELIEKEIVLFNKAFPKGSKEWNLFLEKAKETFKGKEDAFEKYLDSFKDDNKELFEERLSELKKYDEFMKKDVELEFQKITKDDLPKDLSFEQMKLIRFMVK